MKSIDDMTITELKELRKQISDRIRSFTENYYVGNAKVEKLGSVYYGSTPADKVDKTYYKLSYNTKVIGDLELAKANSASFTPRSFVIGFSKTAKEMTIIIEEIVEDLENIKNEIIEDQKKRGVRDFIDELNV